MSRLNKIRPNDRIRALTPINQHKNENHEPETHNARLLCCKHDHPTAITATSRVIAIRIHRGQPSNISKPNLRAIGRSDPRPNRRMSATAKRTKSNRLRSGRSNPALIFFNAGYQSTAGYTRTSKKAASRTNASLFIAYPQKKAANPNAKYNAGLAAKSVTHQEVFGLGSMRINIFFLMRIEIGTKLGNVIDTRIRNRTSHKLGQPMKIDTRSIRKNTVIAVIYRF